MFVDEESWSRADIINPYQSIAIVAVSCRFLLKMDSIQTRILFVQRKFRIRWINIRNMVLLHVFNLSCK